MQYIQKYLLNLLIYLISALANTQKKKKAVEVTPVLQSAIQIYPKLFFAIELFSFLISVINIHW